MQDALSPDELSLEKYLAAGRGVLSLDDALAFLPVHEVGDREAHLAANGNSLHGVPLGLFRAHGPEGLIGVYEGQGDVGRPLIVFPKVA